MSDTGTRWADPWDHRWLERDDMLTVVDERIALSRTRRYRAGALRERVLRRPVRADTPSLHSLRWLVSSHGSEMRSQIGIQ